MAKVKGGGTSTTGNTPKKIRPALDPAARENQMIALAMDLVEQRLLDGTATSQEVTHFLKLGTERERLERERLRVENELSRAKKEALASQKRMEELYSEAIAAMKRYAGHGDEVEEDYDEY